MRIDAIAIGNNPPDDVNVIIEVPIGGEPIKYEMDKAAGTLVVDRFLHTAMRYPGNYGFIPHTLSVRGIPPNDPLTHHNVLSLEITGELWAKPYPLELLLKTDMDLESGEVRIAERR